MSASDLAVLAGEIAGGILAVISLLALLLRIPQRFIRRRRRFKELRRDARARCIALWLAVGVTEDLACDLADNRAVGSSRLTPASLPRPVALLIAEHGAGKSLVGYRLLQSELDQPLVHGRWPLRRKRLPVVMAARDAFPDLRNSILGKTNEIGDASRSGVFLLIDGADQLGAGEAADLLEEARVLGHTWPHTQIVITSRPLPFLSSAIERASVRLLDENEQLRIISLIAGRDVGLAELRGWPKAMRESLPRPLYSILLGQELARHHGVPMRPMDLLAAMIRNAFTASGLTAREHQAALATVGNLSLLRGGDVPLNEVPTDVDIDPLLQSGLVVQRESVLEFPLPIIAQWAAAARLAEDPSSIHHLLATAGALDRAFYALTVAVATFEYHTVREVLVPLVDHDPAFAGRLIHEVGRTWPSDDASALQLSWDEAGSRLRDAYEFWGRGLDDLSARLGLSGQQLPTLGVDVHPTQRRITIAWQRTDPSLPPIVHLPGDFNIFSPSEGWDFIRAGVVSAEDAWPFEWAHNEYRRRLAAVLRTRAFVVATGPLVHEATWRLGLRLTRKGTLSHDPIPLSVFDGLIDLDGPLPTQILDGRAYDLEAIRRFILELATCGPELQPPWPPPDRGYEASSGFVWDLFSPEQLLRRTESVYASAIEGYEAIVNEWLQPFAQRLRTHITLPAVLRGTLTVADPTRGLIGPVIDWHLDPLPRGSTTSVALSLADASAPQSHEAMLNDLSERHRRLVQMRPQAAEWISAHRMQSVLEVFSATPITQLTYEWLWNDLIELGWTEGSNSQDW